MEETSSHTVQFASQSRRFGKQVENNYFEVVINFMKLWYFDILTSLQFVLMFDVSDFEAVSHQYDCFYGRMCICLLALLLKILIIKHLH